MLDVAGPRGRYRAFGLVLDSACALPCAPVRGRRSPDLVLRPASRRVCLQARARAAPPSPDADVRTWRFADGTVYLGWPGLFDFFVSPDGRLVWYRREAGVSRESLSLYLLGPALSFALLARGVESLHATTVAIDGRAVALLGDSGSGKSTLAAALLGRGARLVADDLLVPRKGGLGWLVEPGVPRLKLMPEARPLCGPGARGASPLVPGARKLIVALRGDETVRRPLPLRACYVLAPRRSDQVRPRVASLGPREAWVELLRSAFNLMVRDRLRLARQFAVAAHLAAAVPVRRLEYPRALARLPEVCDALLDSLA